MSRKNTWQKVCQSIKKFTKMSKDKKHKVQEEIKKNQEENKPPTQESLENIEPINKIEEELNEEKNKYIRLYAEFENYKKRTRKEKEELVFLANEKLLLDLLPILDDFERAIKQMENTEQTGLLEGVLLIQNKLKETLAKKHLKAIEVNTGDTFDADLHEAITQIPTPSEDLKGKIMDVIETGYTLGEKTIRYPKVVVGQ